MLVAAENCSYCGEKMGYIFGRRGLGVRERGHESRCQLRQKHSNKRLERNMASTTSSASHVERILQDLQLLRRFELSPEAVQKLEQIERSADQLLPLVNAGLALAIWAAPLPHEQAEWLQLNPIGGKLLHTQVLIFAAGLSSEEWFMGRIFISEQGVAVQGFSGAIAHRQEAKVSSGLLPWDTIADMAQKNTVLIMHLREGTLDQNVLRLQMGMSAECDRLRQAWAQYKENENLSFHSFLSVVSTVSAMDSTSTTTGGSTVSENDNDDGLRHMINSQIMKNGLKSFQLKAEAPITQTFYVATDELALPTISEPLCSVRFPNVSLETVRRCFEKDNDWFLCRFQMEALKASELQVTPWTQGHLVNGSLVRRICFKVPAPDDVPKALAKMIGFPPIVDSILIARLHCEEDQITLLMRSMSLNVPYGDSLTCEDILQFKVDKDGGVTVSKYIKMVFGKNLPWTMNMAKSFMRHKVKMEGASTWDQMTNLLRKEFEV